MATPGSSASRMPLEPTNPADTSSASYPRPAPTSTESRDRSPTLSSIIDKVSFGYHGGLFARYMSFKDARRTDQERLADAEALIKAFADAPRRRDALFAPGGRPSATFQSLADAQVTIAQLNQRLAEGGASSTLPGGLTAPAPSQLRAPPALAKGKDREPSMHDLGPQFSTPVASPLPVQRDTPPHLHRRPTDPKEANASTGDRGTEEDGPMEVLKHFIRGEMRGMMEELRGELGSRNATSRRTSTNSLPPRRRPITRARHDSSPCRPIPRYPRRIGSVATARPLQSIAATGPFLRNRSNAAGERTSIHPAAPLAHRTSHSFHACNFKRCGYVVKGL